MKETLLTIVNTYLEQGIDPISKESELWKRFGKRYAILVIDSSGFTRTTRKYGIIHFLTKLVQMQNIATPILKEHGCISYVMESDSIIALFPDVLSTMHATLEISDSIKDEGLMLSECEPFQICAGIGYGDLLVTGMHGDFFGSEVNLASKLGEDTADATELMLTEAAYASLPNGDKALFTEKSSSISKNNILHYLRIM